MFLSDASKDLENVFNNLVKSIVVPVLRFFNANIGSNTKQVD